MSLWSKRNSILSCGIRELYRIKTKVGAVLETKIPSPLQNYSISTILSLLDNYINGNLVQLSSHETCYAYKTHLHSRSAYRTLAQIRLISAYKNIFTMNNDISAKEKAIAIGNYLEHTIDKRNIVPFHLPDFFPQDEGVSTFWAILSFLDLYSITDNLRYLNNAHHLGVGGREHLFQDGFGYLHNIGYNCWYPNVSAVAALAYYRLYKETNDEQFLEWMNDGLKYSMAKMRKNGLFPYSQKNPSTYISIYQAITIFLLTSLLNESTHSISRLESELPIAVSYLKKLIRKDGSIIEPDMSCYAYLTTTVASLIVLKKYQQQFLYKKVQKFLPRFFTQEKPFLCITSDGYLYNGTMAFSYDVLITEVFYWITNLIN